MLYLDILMDERQEYTDYSVLPDPSRLSEPALKTLRTLWDMGGKEQVTYWPEDNDPYVRALWFADGAGRAYIGYAEAMAAMGDAAKDMVVRRFSYGSGTDIPLFYTDMVGIGVGIGEEKKALACDLANILVSAEVLTAMSRPARDGGSPQYLLTARKSVYDALSPEFPLYSLLKEVVVAPDDHVFRLGVHARQFIAEMEKTLADRID